MTKSEHMTFVHCSTSCEILPVSPLPKDRRERSHAVRINWELWSDQALLLQSAVYDREALSFVESKVGTKFAPILAFEFQSSEIHW
jgi:hypothetical protein